MGHWVHFMEVLHNVFHPEGHVVYFGMFIKQCFLDIVDIEVKKK